MRKASLKISRNLHKTVKYKINVEMNIIESEKKNFEEISNSGNNVIKIDNFVIYEKNDFTNSNNTITNNEVTEKNPKIFELQENEKVKIAEIIKNVESLEPSLKITQKMCIKCNSNIDYNSLLKFKNLEEFLYFLKYCFVTKYKDYIQEDNQAIFKNKEIFFDYFINYEKHYKSGYIFKSLKYLCRICFTSTLKQKNGFNTLFNLLQISNNVLNSISVKSNKNQERSSIFMSKGNDKEIKMHEKSKEIFNNNYTEIDKSNFNIIVSREVLKNHPFKNDIETNINGNHNNFKNLVDLMKNNLNNLPIMTKSPSKLNPPPTINAPINTNLQNVIKIPNPQNFNNLSLNMIIGNNNVNFHSTQTNLDQNHEKISSNFGKLNEIITNETNMPVPKADERENSTINTNNETDKNEFEKKKEFGNNVYNILDDLKNQVASMHYYSTVQKYFINYIFKNLESFIEQVAPNSNIRQSLGEILENNNSLLNNPLLSGDQNNKNFAAEALNLIKKMSGNSAMNNMPGFPNPIISPNLSNFPNLQNIQNMHNMPNLPNNNPSSLLNLPNMNIFQQLFGNSNTPNLPDLNSFQSLINQIQGSNSQSNTNNNPNPQPINNHLNLGNLFGNSNSSGVNSNSNDLNKNILSELLRNMESNQNNLNNNNSIPSTNNNNQSNNNPSNTNMGFVNPNNNPAISNKNKQNSNFLMNNLMQSANPNNASTLNTNNSQNNHFASLLQGGFLHNQQQNLPNNIPFEQLQKIFLAKSMGNQIGNMNSLSSLPNLPNLPNLNNLQQSLLNNQTTNTSNNNQMNFNEFMNSFRNTMSNLVNNTSLSSNLMIQNPQNFPYENPFNLNAPNPNNNMNNSNTNMHLNNPFLSHLSNLFSNQNNNNNK